MTDRDVGRRTMLAATATLLTGCMGGFGGDGPTLNDETDGYPPPFDDIPDPRTIDTDAFPTISIDGTQVPLAPIDVAYYWYRRREARFADARGQPSYERSHILGAVLSPAPDGGTDDPVSLWPKTDRIICYCGCPHHLSALRAATLIEAGYEEVYVIDEGFWEWHDRRYPMAGDAISEEPATYVLSGWTDPAYQGETVWARHPPTGQREATRINSDGSYRLELRFTAVTLESVIHIETPDYGVAASLERLLKAPITGGTDGRPNP